MNVSEKVAVTNFVFVCAKNKNKFLKMQRIAILRKSKLMQVVPYRLYHDSVQKRFLATVKEIFPNKTDFPSRHIGPRKTEVVAMLDTLGFKVMRILFVVTCILIVISCHYFNNFAVTE